jgi:hypothetical protein
MSQFISIFFIGSSPQYVVSILLGSFPDPSIREKPGDIRKGRQQDRRRQHGQEEGKDALAMIAGSPLFSPLLRRTYPQRMYHI